VPAGVVSTSPSDFQYSAADEEERQIVQEPETYLSKKYGINLPRAYVQQSIMSYYANNPGASRSSGRKSALDSVGIEMLRQRGQPIPSSAVGGGAGAPPGLGPGAGAGAGGGSSVLYQ
jgi:hypothetical protein